MLGYIPSWLTGTTTLLEKLNKCIEEIENIRTAEIRRYYPVGSIYLTFDNESPALKFGGTWEQIKDKFLLGAGNLHSIDEVGGIESVILTENQMPSHYGHLYDDWAGHGNATTLFLSESNFSYWGEIARGWNKKYSSEMYPAGRAIGGNESHTNMPPYITIYMWKRIA